MAILRLLAPSITRSEHLRAVSALPSPDRSLLNTPEKGIMSEELSFDLLFTPNYVVALSNCIQCPLKPGQP
jgi:hypothetical protein